MRHKAASVILPALAALVLALALWGCAAKPPVGAATAPSGTARAGEADFDVFSGEYENTPDMLSDPPRSLAVLPFGGDPTRWIGAGQGDPRPAVRRAMYNHLSSLPFTDQELHITDALLAEAGLTTPEAVAATLEDSPTRLHEILGVDAVVIGEVTHYDRAFAGVFSQAAVGCDVRMRRMPDGALLWRAEHVSRGFGGGPAITPVGLVLAAISSLWNLRDDQLMRETDALFREMVATIRLPGNNPHQPAVSPPVMDLFAVMGSETPFPEGRPVIMRMVGDPGCLAYGEIIGTGKTIELTPAPRASRRAVRDQLLSVLAKRYADLGAQPEPAELEAAVAALEAREIYEGAYYPEPGVEAWGAPVRGTLTSLQGGRLTRLFERRVDIDAAPPKAPENLRATAGAGRVTLTWDAVAAPDLAAYEVLTSASGLADFSPRAQTPAPLAEIVGLPDFTPLYLRVAAIDRAGNRSIVSPAAKAVPMPVPGLEAATATGQRLGGAAQGLLFLPAGGGPYFIESDLAIKAGAELHVGPGAVIRFAPGTGLRVEGGSLFVWGDTDRPVRFVPESPAAKPGTWAGIVLDGAARVRITGARVLGARIGVTVRNCAPRIEGSVIRASSQAGLLLSDGAQPSLTCSLIKGNGGMGGMVAEGAGLAPAVRDTAFLGNEPFDVQNFAPVDLDLSGNWFAADPALTVLGRALTAPALPAPAPGCPAPRDSGPTAAGQEAVTAPGPGQAPSGPSAAAAPPESITGPGISPEPDPVFLDLPEPGNAPETAP